MSEEYERMQWLKKKALQIFVWGLGVPAAIIYFVDPIERLVKLIARFRNP